jgi:hypothetical protein
MYVALAEAYPNEGIASRFGWCCMRFGTVCKGHIANLQIASSLMMTAI